MHARMVVQGNHGARAPKSKHSEGKVVILEHGGETNRSETILVASQIVRIEAQIPECDLCELCQNFAQILLKIVVTLEQKAGECAMS